MKRTTRPFFAMTALLVFLILVLAAGCSKPNAEKAPSAGGKQPGETQGKSGVPAKMSFITLPSGNTQYAISLGISKLVTAKGGPQITVQSAPGAVNVVKVVASGEAQFGSAISATSYWGYKGGPGFDKPLSNIRVLQAGSLLLHSVITTKDKGINQIADLKGKKFTYIMPTSSYNTELGKKILEVYGLKPDEVTSLKSENADNALLDLGEGKTDAVIASAGTGMVQELATKTTPVFIPLGADKVKEMQKQMPFIFPEVTPSNPPLLATPGGVPVIGAPILIITSDSLPEEVAYSFVKITMENYKELASSGKELVQWTPENAVKSLGIPYHPGAIKYYKEAGLWKPEAEVAK